MDLGHETEGAGIAEIDYLQSLQRVTLRLLKENDRWKFGIVLCGLAEPLSSVSGRGRFGCAVRRQNR